jgi:hypothetical protein
MEKKKKNKKKERKKEKKKKQTYSAKYNRTEQLCALST